MAKLEVLEYPDQRLRQQAKEVSTFDAELHQFIDNLAETMYKESGVGLAATQVGEMRRVVVMDISKENDKLIEIVNPRIIAQSGKISYEEGCLSIPGYREKVSRYQNVTLEYQDRHGKKNKLEASDLLAVCAQHELDHLDGVLFIDRLSRLKREMFKRWFKKQVSNAGPHE